MSSPKNWKKTNDFNNSLIKHEWKHREDPLGTYILVKGIEGNYSVVRREKAIRSEYTISNKNLTNKEAARSWAVNWMRTNKY